MIVNGPIKYVHYGDSETLKAENSNVVLISSAELFK